MKWVKIWLLVVLTLAAMRASSWVLGWLLTRLVTARIRTVAIAANLTAFTAFLLLLYFSLLPGEPLDWAAVVFGLIVFVICTAIDFFWRPWKQRV